MRSFTRLAYAPLVLLGINGVGLVMIDRGAPGAVVLGLLAAVVALSFLAEWLAPYQPAWNRSLGDLGRDTLHAIVNEAANFSSLLLLPWVATWIPAAELWPGRWPFALQVLLAVLVLDAGITLAHFASHRFRLLWRFHAVHHSVERMYGFNGLMKHPIHQSIETLAGTAPLVLMGLPAKVALALVFLVAVPLLLQHSNVDYRLGVLRTWLAANEVHRFHHRKEAVLGDVNFGLFTTLWDRMLGTFHFEERARFSSDELGVGGRPDYPVGYVDQLVEPFRRGG